MKKRQAFFVVLVLTLGILVGCNGKTYSFKLPVEEIHTIEIVSAENSLEYVVIKTLSEAEEKDFLEKFQDIKFQEYILGDPMSINGTAVKITFENGDYEMICHYWSEYVKEGEINFVKKSCEEKDFNNLVEMFLKE